MISPDWNPSEKTVKQFATIALFGFGLLGVVARWKFGSETAGWIFWALAVATFVVGRIRPLLVLPVYLGLMLITLPIGRVVSAVILRVLYYVLFTSLGLFFRLVGRDPLLLKRPDGQTYWREREGGRDPESYFRQA